jgi:hypothetical protein
LDFLHQEQQAKSPQVMGWQWCAGGALTWVVLAAPRCVGQLDSSPGVFLRVCTVLAEGRPLSDIVSRNLVFVIVSKLLPAAASLS